MQLKNFVMVMFEDDSMMIPKESAWFGFYTPGQDENITKLEDSVLYQVVRFLIFELNLIIKKIIIYEYFTCTG